MINTYEEYLNTEKHLALEDMHQLHQTIISEINTDEDALELYKDLIKTAVKYAVIRAEWLSLEREQKMERDSSRTSCHNSLIIKFNMLSRYMKMQGKDAAWRDTLGYEEDDPYNRKRIGDFACYLAFVNGLNAR